MGKTKMLVMDLDFIHAVKHYGNIVFDQQFQTGAGLDIRQTMWCYEGEQFLEVRTNGTVRAFFKVEV